MYEGQPYGAVANRQLTDGTLDVTAHLLIVIRKDTPVNGLRGFWDQPQNRGSCFEYEPNEFLWLTVEDVQHLL
jgi:hypothetical protein